MARIALASLQQSLEKIILNQHQNSNSPYQNEQIRSIYDQVLFLQHFANDSPAKPDFPDRRLNDFAHKAKNVIELFIWEKDRSSKINFNQQLRQIREEIDSIAGELKETDTIGDVAASLSANSSSPAITEEAIEMETVSSPTADLQVSDPSSKTSPSNSTVSLGDDLLAIKSRLCGGSTELQFIPIVGMGGIGKSTLARNVFNDTLATHYFDIRAWVTVSQDYSTEKIVSSLMDSMKDFVEEKFGQKDEETVYKGLKGRRYLIVVDDVWCKKTWDDLRHVCPNDHNGSRIILTTRLSDVALYFNSHSPLHQMRFMSDEESWELIRHRVLGDKHCSPQLEKIGKKIAKSCRGLPLAVVVIAGLLSTVETKPDSWRAIAENVSSIVATEDDGKIDKILSLSYTHLPHHLRCCFLYMGGFPEDHDIRVSKLVRLWVADDFLRHSEGSSKSLEDEAEKCLEDLANRNLVLVTRRRWNGKIQSCSLHDLIRDLCIRKAQETNSFVNLLDGNVEGGQHFIAKIKDQHRVSLTYPMLRYLSRASCPSIHTIMCFSSYMYEDPPEEFGKKFLKSVKSLRVLDAENVGIQSLSHEIFKLIHLRYLAFRFADGFTFPVAISKLQSLQTLVIDVRNWKMHISRPGLDFDFKYLPREIWMLPQLRHLICYGWFMFPYPKDLTTSTLENLQTLSLVFHDVCVRWMLEKMPHIKKLGLDCSSYNYDAHLNNLVHLHQLENLELRNGNWPRESICFPRTLRKLSLYRMSLPWSEMSVIGSLPNLQVLKLRDFACIGSTWETSQGEFPELQFLLIEYSELQHWISESDHFPRLRFLLLHKCRSLDEIPEGFGESATLEMIEIKSHKSNPVKESLAESAKRIQEEQRSYGDDAFQLRMEMMHFNFEYFDS